VSAPFQFEQSIAFSPEGSAEILRAIPALPGVFALHGPRAPEGQPAAQPYLTRAADLRRRITRILAPPDSQSKRLNLRDRVARIDYTITGSEFESTLALYHAAATIFGLDEARRRLKLRTPFFLRFTAENAYPRVYSTNRLAKRALDNFYGPFPSRAAADRYCDAVLDLFKLRRCVEELAPYPEHPGCVYQEMKKCLAPCNQAYTPEGSAAYEHEADEVKRFFDTHGESLIIAIGLAREEASNALHFERAAELHAQWHKVKAAQSLADELVQPIPKLRAILVQKAAQPAVEATPLSPSGSAPLLPSGSAPLLPSGSAPLLPSGSAPLLPSGNAPLLPSGNAPLLSSGNAPLLSSGNAPLLSSGNAPLLSSGNAPLLSSRSNAEGSAFFSATEETEPTAAIFLLQSGCILGPERLSTLGVRAVKEQTSVGSSLFAQPLMLQAIPLEEPTPTPVILSEDATAVVSQSKDPEELDIANAAHSIPPSPPEAAAAPTLNPELRATNLIAALEERASAPTDLATLSDHLSLLRRWYYRPEKQRTGEVFFPREDATWPIRRILRGAARMALGDPKPMAETHRDQATRNPADEAQKPTRIKVLHEGRPDVERVVPIIDKPPKFKSRRSRSATKSEVSE
jgi:hypothetical protein